MAKDKPVPDVAPVKASWDDGMADASPKTARYFDAVRTEAYENRNPVANYIEFWVALRVDRQEDKWRVMHYVIFDLDLEDGKFKAEVASKQDGSFAEAVYQLAVFNNMASGMGANQPLAMTAENFPADKFPELQVYFFDIENYRLAANIEQIAFDEADRPYRRIGGKVFASATYKRSEIVKSISGPGLARDNPKLATRIEEGVLSDIFHSAAAPGASLDSTVNAYQVLAGMDDFVSQLGAFYIGLQRVLGKTDNFDKVQGLTEEERKKLYNRAVQLLRNDRPTLSDLLDDALPKAAVSLSQVEALGAHVEPFQKDLAEFELYVHLLMASQSLKKYQDSLQSPLGADVKELTQMQESVRRAKEKFSALGGPVEHFDRLQAWVRNDKKDVIPGWFVTWFNRYYDQRQKAITKVQGRKADALRAVNTLPVKIKPPIIE